MPWSSNSFRIKQQLPLTVKSKHVESHSKFSYHVYPRYTAEILPILRKTPSNQSINNHVPTSA